MGFTRYGIQRIARERMKDMLHEAERARLIPSATMHRRTKVQHRLAGLITRGLSRLGVQMSSFTRRASH